MVRTRERRPTPPNGFVASAARLPTVERNQAGKPMSWQAQAWRYYDEVGELRYIATWVGNVMSRARLHAAVRVGNSLELVTEGPAREAMDALYGGPQLQAEMLQLLGADMTVSGEGYITARGNDWDVLTTGQVTQDTRGNITADFGESKKVAMKTGTDLVIRVWTPHPTNPNQADAPTRSNLKTLSQIVGYDDHITAQLTSRLAGAGIVFLPSEIEFAAAQENDPEATQASSFVAALTEASMAAMKDRSSPAAFVPVIVTAPGEFLDKIVHMKFWSELDRNVIEMRQSAIQRFAIGMDVPPETIMGTADSNHWNAWLSEESGIKAHLEPRLAVVASALTTAYLRPALDGQVPNVDEFYVIADTSDIRARPNKSTDAMEMHDRGLINQDAVRRETGFKDEDKMDEEEMSRWLLQRIATGAVTPELTAEALRLLGAGIDPKIVVSDVPQGQPDHTRSDTVINDDGQVGGIPEDAPLLAACSVLVFRALERAGNRLRNVHPMTDTQAMAAHNVYLTLGGDVDHLLAGAWDCAPEVLKDYNVDTNEVVGLLDFYTRGLLSQKRTHSNNTLSRLLTASHLEALATPA